MYHSFPLHFPSFLNQRLRPLLTASCLLVAHHVGRFMRVSFPSCWLFSGLAQPRSLRRSFSSANWRCHWAWMSCSVTTTPYCSRSSVATRRQTPHDARATAQPSPHPVRPV